ncbi:MAG TPA: TIGR03619 family F420-dependent LLM class oxidoreductase [Acidimicrobiia bacterium]|nr:TIGR03619 family F420-dependent LLM class oxidoreductase [Acidimicrobiia bacterium]
MRIGLNLVMVRPDAMPGIAARAEALGYESVFVPDHLFFPSRVASRYPYTPDGSFPYAPSTPLFDPWLVLTNIAAGTRRIKLGTAVYVLPLRHPFVTARAVTTLDVLSGGRAVLGVGAGWLTEEFTGLGLDARTRFSRTEEAIAVIRALWTETEVSFHGKHFAFDGVCFEPKPVTSPHPPILLGGDTDQALARAVRAADGWISAGTTATVESRVAKITELRAELGATRPFELTVLHPSPSVAELSRYADIGVDRVVVMPWQRGRDAVAGLEAFAADVLGAR